MPRRAARLVQPSEKRAPAPVYTVRPDVMEEALRLADGNRERLEIRSTNTVVVHNSPQQRRKATRANA